MYDALEWRGAGGFKEGEMRVGEGRFGLPGRAIELADEREATGRKWGKLFQVLKFREFRKDF